MLRAQPCTTQPLHCWHTLLLTTSQVASRLAIEGAIVVTSESADPALGDPPDRTATVGDVGERRLIAMFTAAARRGDPTPGDRPAGDTADDGTDVVIGSGDDAAVIDVGPTVISTDTAVAGRHFRLDWSDAAQIGQRAVIQSAADIAAMGGRVVGVVAALGCPRDTPVGWLLDLNDAIAAQTHRLGGRVLGGDLVQSDDVVVSITVVGALDGLTPVTLSGARVADVIAVSGPLGTAAAGLAVLTRSGAAPMARWGREGDPRARVAAAFAVPAPDLTQGVSAARAGAHAMTDVSDGLIEELITMSQASQVSLHITSDRVPRIAEVTQVGALLGADVRNWVLTGGEDHEMLAVFAPDDVPHDWSVIGRVGPGPAAVLVDGAPPADLTGWQSFD